MSSEVSKSKTREELAKYFHLPITEAAKQLGVCPTVLKKICRKNGISRWPHRKIKSIDKYIYILKASLLGNNSKEDEEIQQEIRRLEEQRELIMKHPNTNIKIKRINCPAASLSSGRANPTLLEAIVSHPNTCKISSLKVEKEHEYKPVVMSSNVPQQHTLSQQNSFTIQPSNFSLTGSPDVVISPPQSQQNFSFTSSTKSLEPTTTSNTLKPDTTKISIPAHHTEWPQLGLKKLDPLPPTNSPSPNSSDIHTRMISSFQSTTTPMQLTTMTHKTEILHNFNNKHNNNNNNNNNNNKTIVNLCDSSPISYRHHQLQERSECQVLYDDCRSHSNVNSYNDQCQCNDHSSFSLSISSSFLICLSEVKKKMSVANLLSTNDGDDESNSLPSLQSDIQLSFPEWFQEEKRNYLSLTKIPTK